MYAKIAMDVVALGAQTTGFVMWPLLEKDKNPTELVIIPVTLFLVSCGYWENYVNKHSLFGKQIARFPRDQFRETSINLKNTVRFRRFLETSLEDQR